MSIPQPKHVKRPQPVEDFAALARRAREEEETLSGILVEHMTLEGADFSGLTLADAAFSHCRFPGCDWSGCSFTDVTFHTCDLSSGNLEDTFWLRFVLRDSKSMGARLQNSRLRQGLVEQSRLSCANLDRAKLREVRFSHADLGGSFFTHCAFTKVEFVECDLRQAAFVHTPLKNVDLSTSQIGGLTLSEDSAELRGAVVDFQQAADLARRLGVVIRE